MATETVRPADGGPQEPHALLQAMDGWLDATGHDASHPWRRSIAQSLDLYPPERPRPVLFERFSYYADTVPRDAPSSARELARLADCARSVADGVRDILAILERDIADAGCDDGEGNRCPALLPASVAGNLHRLSVVALEMLSDQACRAGDAAGESAGAKQ